MKSNRCWRMATRADASTTDTTSRTLPLVLATETPVPVFDPLRGPVQEVLVMAGGVLPRQLPLLDSHSRHSISDVVGSIRQLRVEGEKLLGVAHFANTKPAMAAYELARDGHLTDVSIGFQPDRVRWLDKGDSTAIAGRTYRGPLRLVESWSAKEGSLVAIGADSAAKLRPSMRAYFSLAGQRGLDAYHRPTDSPPAFVIHLDGAEIPIPADLLKAEQQRFLESLPAAFERQFQAHVGALMARAKTPADVDAAAEFHRSIPKRLTALQVGLNAARQYLDDGFLAPSLTAS